MFFSIELVIDFLKVFLNIGFKFVYFFYKFFNEFKVVGVNVREIIFVGVIKFFERNLNFVGILFCFVSEMIVGFVVNVFFFFEYCMKVFNFLK